MTEINDKKMEIEITGESNAVAKGPWLLGENIWTPPHDLDHEIKSKILGNATYDLQEKKFIHFELVALCKWRGKTQNNGRNLGAGRRSVWSDPRIINISKQFIPSTDEVWRLQGGDEEDASMFQKMANEGHYKKEGSTRQGIYVCSPNGTLLSSINSLNPDAVLESIMKGLDKWKLLPESERYLPDKFSPK